MSTLAAIIFKDSAHSVFSKRNLPFCPVFPVIRALSLRFVVILSALLALSGPVWGQNSNRPGTLSNAPAPSGFPSNPFRDSENFQIVRISDAVLSGREAGLIHSPRRLDLRFRLYDEKNRSQPGLGTNAGPLRFTLWKEGRQIPVPAGSVFTGDVHLASLPLPRVESSGWADLEIKVGVGPALRLPNAVYYRAQELSVIFIVDQSGSMNDNDPKSIRILAVIDSLQDGALKNTVKEIALVTFGDAAAVALPFTAMARFADIRAAFTPKPASGKTDIPGALKLAASHIQERRPPGKVVAILLTDGASTTPLQNEPQLFQKAGIPLYTVGLRGEKSAEYDEAILKKIAADTGALFSGGQTVDLKSIYQRSLLHGLG